MRNALISHSSSNREIALMSTQRSGRSSESGQILIMAAGGLIVLLLVAGLVIDLGLGFRERRTIQNASDLAAMAGTKVIADHYLDGGRTGDQVFDAVSASLAGNDCATGCTWTGTYVRPAATPGTEIDLGPLVDGGTIPALAQGVRITADTASETFFMRVVGIDEVAVGTEATAMTSSLLDEAPGGVLLPIAAFDSDYEPGVEYELTEGEEGPGNFGFLTWSGANDSGTLADSICVADNPAMQFPVWIEGAPGNMNANHVRNCLDQWLGETVLIPIWSQTNNSGGSGLDYEIVGLAAFTLTSYDQHASKVNGHFVEFYALPGVPAGYGRPPCLSSDPTCASRTNFIGLTR
jgi:Putative Flp pilus-assembly TadE/G-like